MVVKQGITAYGGEVGRGQLNSAYAGLGTLCSIIVRFNAPTLCLQSRLSEARALRAGATGVGWTVRILPPGSCGGSTSVPAVG